MLGARGTWPLWTSAVVLLVLIDTRTRADTEPDHDSSRCYGCVPGEGGCDSPPEIKLCGRGNHCAITATTPELASKLTCIEEDVVPCSLKYSEETKSYNITCACGQSHCSHFSDLILRNLTKFTAVDTKKKGDLIRDYLKFANLSHITDDEIMSTLLNMTQNKQMRNDVWAQKSTISEQEPINALKQVIGVESLPKPEALKHEATVPSEDDEDEGEGSGAEERPRSPPAPPAAPSSFLPADANSANSYFPNLILTPLFLYLYILT